jgi:hypothetical protein
MPNVGSYGLHAGNRASEATIRKIQEGRTRGLFPQISVDSPVSSSGNYQRATRRAMERRSATSRIPADSPVSSSGNYQRATQRAIQERINRYRDIQGR